MVQYRRRRRAYRDDEPVSEREPAPVARRAAAFFALLLLLTFAVAAALLVLYRTGPLSPALVETTWEPAVDPPDRLAATLKREIAVETTWEPAVDPPRNAGSSEIGLQNAGLAVALDALKRAEAEEAASQSVQPIIDPVMPTPALLPPADRAL
jgi:hypothetical protein